MGIKVKFLTALKEVTGTSSAEFDTSFNTFERVMEELLRSFPKLKDELFCSDGTIDYLYQIILNGKRLSWPEDKNVRIKNGDQLLFMVNMVDG